MKQNSLDRQKADYVLIEIGISNEPDQPLDFAVIEVTNSDGFEANTLDYYTGIDDALEAGAKVARQKNLDLVLDDEVTNQLVGLLRQLSRPAPKPTIVVYHDGGAFYDVSGDIDADVIFLDTDLDGRNKAEVVTMADGEKLCPLIWGVEHSEDLVADAHKAVQVRAKQEERAELEKAGAIDAEVTG